MSLTASYWGPPVWKTLYIVAYGYPDNPTEEQQEYANFLYEAILQHLPCDECQEHCNLFLKQHPIQEATCDHITLLRWVNMLEGSVGSKLQLPSTSLEARIAEMDRSNPNLPKKPIAKPQLFYRHSGTVSYGVKRAIPPAAAYTKPPAPAPEPKPPATAVADTAPKQRTTTTAVVGTEPTHRGRRTVSYGIRKSTNKRNLPRGGCASCGVAPPQATH